MPRVTRASGFKLYERLSAIPRRVRAALETLSHFQVLENRDRKWFVVDRSLLDGK